MRLAYITNTSLKESSGGGSGVNFATYNHLKDSFDTDYYLINPRQDFKSKVTSVILKKLHLKRNYHHFSDFRLNNVAKQFQDIRGDFDAYFFHGFTQWIDTNPIKPYFCFNDACFATYVEIYNDKKEFQSNDLNRIYKKEAKWLKNAEKVFFRSEWALNETKKAYNLEGENFLNVGVGGFIDIPERDIYKSDYKFLFISREFKPKGGEVVLKAFRVVKEKYTNIEINVVGDAPPEGFINDYGVRYIGFVDKKNEVEKRKLLEIFNSSFALLHPTKKDINPLVLIELAYYGCPAISSNSFAIPEYIIDGQTGFLLQDETDEQELAEKMEYLIVNRDAYLNMRKMARRNAIKNNTWNAVGNRIVNVINNK
ncbi:MAG: glycosyltransferase family 4 protein [Gelidibacter sp.]